MMEKFYAKYVTELGDKAAIKLVHDKATEAKEAHMKEDETSYLHFLAKAHEMIEDFFICKGLQVREHLTKKSR